MAVRTKLLVHTTVGFGSSSGEAVIYTGPDSETTIVKTVTFSTTGNNTFTWQLLHERAGNQRPLLRDATPGNTTARFFGWDVIMPGDLLVVAWNNVIATTCHVIISGTQLEGVAD